MNSNLKKKVNSKRGLSTKVWGPLFWDTLFYSVMGAYPIKIDPRNKEHLRIKKAFLCSFYNLRYQLPCSFCRISFITFYKELPVSSFSDSRVNMLKWLYLIKDKINKKLLTQEYSFEKEYISGKINLEEYKKKCFKTVESPLFNEVLNKYSKARATCSKKVKRCV